jgi:hypothetical protein
MGFHALAWFFVVVLGGMWSLFCWAAHAVLTWNGWSRGLDWAKHVPEIDLPAWLVKVLGLDWVEWLQAMLADWGPELQRWLSGLPDLSGWMSTAVWLIWFIGVFLLALAGLVASALIALARRSSAPQR